MVISNNFEFISNNFAFISNNHLGRWEHLKKVNILGTDYKIIVKRYDEDEAFARRGIDGYCNGLTKEIVLCDMATYNGWEYEDGETIKQANKLVLRHEIVHAFFNESGLMDSAFSVENPWSKNEEMIDWIALQGEKIYRAWSKAGAI